MSLPKSITPSNLLKLSDNGDLFVQCAVCGKAISDFSLGAVVMSSGIDSGGVVNIFPVHKGDCHDTADAWVSCRRSQKHKGWIELNSFLCRMGVQQ